MAQQGWGGWQQQGTTPATQGAVPAQGAQQWTPQQVWQQQQTAYYQQQQQQVAYYQQQQQQQQLAQQQYYQQQQQLQQQQATQRALQAQQHTQKVQTQAPVAAQAPWYQQQMQRHTQQQGAVVNAAAAASATPPTREMTPIEKAQQAVAAQQQTQSQSATPLAQPQRAQWAWGNGQQQQQQQQQQQTQPQTQAVARPSYLQLPQRRTPAVTAAWNQQSPTATPQTTAAASPAPAGGGDSAWPPKLRKYVERAFAMCVTDGHRLIVETNLKNLIKDANATGSLWSTNWDAQAMPDFTNAGRQRQSQQQMAMASQLQQFAQQGGKGQKGKKRKQQDQKSSSIGYVTGHMEAQARNQRAKRFEAHLQGGGPSSGPTKSGMGWQLPSTSLQRGDQFFENLDDMEKSFVVKGTCMNVEKSYFRLTSAPDPATVRPIRVLRQALDNVLAKWKSEKDYEWCSDQFKAIRQDLTLQNVKDEFAAKVYEEHARMALENRDYSNYKQCSALLQGFYLGGAAGSMTEFTAYAILYSVCTNSQTEIKKIMRELKTDVRKHHAVQHALQVRTAMADSNYCLFFKLYRDAPDMGACLMDVCVERLRIAALAIMHKTLKPKVPSSAVFRQLGFEHTGGMPACEAFIQKWATPKTPA